MNLTEKIHNLFTDNNIEFEEIHHEKASTCEESAKFRNSDIKIGGKTLLFKSKQNFHLFVISAGLLADSKKVRKILGSSWLRFATAEELMEVAGVEKGALPPFGRPVLPYDLYIDESILENKKIAFNAGSLTTSFILAINDYLKLIDYSACDFRK